MERGAVEEGAGQVVEVEAVVRVVAAVVAVTIVAVPVVTALLVQERS